MRDLEQRLHGVDEVPVPDVVWPKADNGVFEDEPVPRHPRRAAALVVGLVVAAFAVVFVVEVFGGIGSAPEQGPIRNGSIAFLANGPKGSVGQNEDIFMLDPTTGAQTNFTRTTGVVEGSPRWSPNGSHVVFTEYTGSRQRQVVLANGDLSDQRVIEECDCSPVSFAWSPDGLHIAWTGSAPRGKGYTTALQTYDLNSGEVRTICDSTTCGVPGEPVWSPDGTEIAFSNAGYAQMIGIIIEQGPIWVADAESGKIRALTNTPPCTASPVISGQACIFDSQPSWSQDGTSLYFVRSISRGHAGSETLMQVSADGSNLTRLRACRHVTGCDLQLYGPSPDGSQLAYRSGSRLQILDLQSNHVIPIRLPDEARFGEAVWSPDGAQLAVMSGSQDGSIWAVDPQTGTKRTVASGLRWPSDVAWLPATDQTPSSDYEVGLQTVPASVVAAAIDHMNTLFCRAGGFTHAYEGGATTAAEWARMEPTVASEQAFGSLDPTAPVYAVFVSGKCWLASDKTGAPVTGGRVLMSSDGTAINGRGWGGERSGWPASDPPFGGQWDRSDSGVTSSSGGQ